MAAADVLYEGVSGADGLGGAEAFQAEHGSEPCFEPAVVGFDPVVLSGGVDMTCLGQELVEDPRVDRGLVGGDLADLAVLVDRPVQVGPLAGDLDVGLVDGPPVAGPVPGGPGRVGE